MREWVWPEFLARLYRLRAPIFGMLFVLYVLKFQPILLDSILRVRNTGRGDFWLALLIVVIQGCELAGAIWKRPELDERVRRWPNPGIGGAAIVVFTAFLHLGMNSFLFIFTLPAFGVNLSDNSLVSIVAAMTLFFLMMAKEGIILAPFFSKSPPVSQEIDLNAPQFRNWELLGELFLTIYGMVALTLTWDVLLLIAPPGDSHGALFSHYLGGVLFFCFLYPPSRLFFIAEEWSTRQPWWNRVISAAIFGATLYGMVAQMPVK